jgi:hypothetical protein
MGCTSQTGGEPVVEQACCEQVLPAALAENIPKQD